jgi:hypothetical protein
MVVKTIPAIVPFFFSLLVRYISVSERLGVSFWGAIYI